MRTRLLVPLVLGLGSAFSSAAAGIPSYPDPNVLNDPRMSIDDNWMKLGTVTIDTAGKITVGDFCGDYTQPTCTFGPLGNFDNSYALLNPYGWEGYDADALMSKKSLAGNVYVSWDGCIGKTGRSQHQIGLSTPAQNFNGQQNSNQLPITGTEFAFATVWLPENAGKLTMYVPRDVQYWINVPDDATSHAGSEAGGYSCHHYAIQRVDNWVTASVDGQEVYSAASYFPNQPLMLYASDFDSDITLENIHFSDVPPDATPPVIAPQVSPAPNSFGWNNTPVTVSWSVTDAESPVSSSGCDPSTLTTDTPGTTLTCLATSAGGSSQASVTVRLDATPPPLACPADITAVAGSSAGAVVSYAVATPVDTGSGTQSVSTMPASGAQFAPGSTTVNVTAGDLAGNSATCSFQVKVLYNFGGFVSPIASGATTNVANAGSSIPVKFSLGGDMGLGILAAGSPSSSQVPCDFAEATTSEVPASSAGNSGLGYDPVSQLYSYAWKSDRSWQGQCRVLSLQTNDGAVHTARFRFK